MSDYNDGYTDGSPLSGKDTLDKLISYCQHAEVAVPATAINNIPDAQLVRVGNIVFSCNEHSTGAGVRGWIIDGDDVFEFMSVTYWYSSNYTFNRSKHIHGAWDAAVNKAIAELRALAEQHRTLVDQRNKDSVRAQNEAAVAVKARFEKQFTVPHD